jgi:ActR/RegA family two-component response regulator
MESISGGITILIVDDDAPYVEALHRLAHGRGVHLRHSVTLEDAREIFSRHEQSTISGVILDVVGLRDRGQKVPDNSFIIAASRYFADAAPHLPVVVLTGEPDQYRNLKELFRGTMGVYSKGRDEDEVLQFLLDEARKLDRIRCGIQHPEVFEVLRRYLDEDAETELVNCLTDLDSRDPTVIRKNMGTLRRLQEKIYIALSKCEERYVPREYVEGEIKIASAYKHLVERGHVERYKIIDRFSELIFKVTSDHGAHVPYSVPKYQPTRYTVAALGNALMDLILWFGALMGREKCSPSIDGKKE